MMNGIVENKKKRMLVFHPFLIAIYLGLSPLANNVGIVGLEAIRILLTTFIVVTLLTIILNIFLPDPSKTGLLVTINALLLSSYGHVLGFLEQRFAIPPAVDIIAIVIWVGLVVVSTYWILVKIIDPKPWHLYLNFVGAILLMFPLYTLVTYTSSQPNLEPKANAFQTRLLTENGLNNLEVDWSGPGQPRDIYYIVLDGYTREDVLRDLYDYDNTEFLEALRSRGFYIADSAEANYVYTVYSLAAALNLSYLEGAPQTFDAALVDDPKPLLHAGLGYLIRENLLTEVLRQNDYEIIVFDNGYGSAQINEPDHFASSPNIKQIGASDALELIWLDTTVGRVFLKLFGDAVSPLRTLFDNHRERVLFGVTHLSDFSERPGFKFIFSHVISPHYPFVFGPNGESRYGSNPFSLLNQAGISEWDPQLYRDQVHYMNSLIVEEVDQILAASDPDPIIIIHADHSSRSWNNPNPPPQLRERLQFPILVALYLPGSEIGHSPYPDISPVNITRLLLNRYFDADLGMLTDQSYLLHDRGNGWEFVESCQLLGGCP